jgi:hypothetical protein
MTLEENKDLSQFSLYELQSSLINHEHILNRSNMSLENAFFTQSFIIRGGGRERDNSRRRRRIFFIGGCSSSPRNTGGRGQNQNNSQPINQKFDRSNI